MRTRGCKQLFLLIALLFGAFRALPSTLSQKPQTADDVARGRVTFNKDVAPIIFAHCASCHRPGQIAPFSLLTYEDVKARADRIAVVAAQRLMPPWKPEFGKGEFLGQRRLTDAQIRTIVEWVAQGAMEGDASDLPALVVRGDEWQLGVPDLIVTMPTPYQLAASGTDVFRTFVLQIPLSAPRFVRALEFRPGNPRVVHHANIGIDRRRRSRHLDPLDPQPGYPGGMMPDASPEGQLLDWAFGKTPHPAPAGLAWRLEPGSDLVVQLHLQPSGARELVQVSVGFFFSDEEPVRTATTLRMGSRTIDVPAGEREYVITDSYELPVSVELLALQPHAHYLGRRMEATATLPDGTTRWLISIPDWDFRFQDVYRYAEPIRLPKGTIISMRYTYDNSADNVRNPRRPPQRVTWGPKSFDEMGDLWLQVVTSTQEDARILSHDFRRKTYAEDLAAHLRLSQADPSDPLNHDVVAGLYLEGDRNDEAIFHLRESLRINPASAPTHYNLGVALSRQDRREEAVAHFEEAVRVDPDYGEAHNNLAVLLPLLGRLDQALTHAHRAVELRPDNYRAHTNLGRILAVGGEELAAIAALRRALVLQREWLPALTELGWILAASPNGGLRDPHEAIARAEHAARLTGHQDASVLDLLAAAYASGGRFEQARSTARRALNVALAGRMSTLADHIRQRLALYERDQPFRAVDRK
jgi:Flp pilus assembly protein TadD/mono/diheme cytochrome c family protein